MRLIDADTLILAAQQEGAYGYVDAKEIADAPTVDAAPVRHGKWKPYRVRHSRSVKGGMYDKGFRCSLCNYEDGDGEYAYCPNCGAKMEDDDETD